MGRIEDSDLTIQELVLRKWKHEWDNRLKLTSTVLLEMGLYLVGYRDGEPGSFSR
jgi:hypothetical protein